MASQPIWAMRIRSEADGPRAYAYRLAGYVKDADYIWSMTRREYGCKFLPSVETIRAMQADHQRKRDRAKTVAGGDEAQNDNLEAQPGPEPESAPIEKPVDPALSLSAPRHTRILAHVADAFGITRAELCARSRKRSNVIARSTAARLLRNERWDDGRVRYSTPQIARMLGMHDHSSVCHLLNVFGIYRRRYPKMMAAWKLLKRRLAA